MDQIDFYILTENSRRDLQFMVCQLCEKAIEQDMNVVIYTRSGQQALEIDELLWTFKSESFIPHINLASAELDKISQLQDTYPVVIFSIDAGNFSNITESYSHLLINLTDTSPEHYDRFTRLAEMINNEEQSKQLARQRYRHYRQLGYRLNQYDL